jgi:HD superfamily phosphohydrolase
MELSIYLLFMYHMIFVFLFFIGLNYLIKIIKYKKLENKPRKYNNKNTEDIKTLFDELNTLKGIQHKTKDTLRNIVRKLPFKGEDWIQEFIREDVDDNLRRYEENQRQEQEEQEEEKSVDNGYDYYEERRNFNDMWSKIFHDSVQQRLDDMIISVSDISNQDVRFDN